jgi:hypothetical protein
LSGGGGWLGSSWFTDVYIFGKPSYALPSSNQPTVQVILSRNDSQNIANIYQATLGSLLLLLEIPATGERNSQPRAGRRPEDSGVKKQIFIHD